MNEKKRAFCAGDLRKVKEIQKDIFLQTAKCKAEYKAKIERQFSTGSLRNAWQGLKSIIGCNKRQQCIDVPDNLAFANDLNIFYTMFD